MSQILLTGVGPTGSDAGAPAASFWLMEDASSKWLMEDGTSFWLIV